MEDQSQSYHCQKRMHAPVSSLSAFSLFLAAETSLLLLWHHPTQVWHFLGTAEVLCGCISNYTSLSEVPWERRVARRSTELWNAAEWKKGVFGLSRAGIHGAAESGGHWSLWDSSFRGGGDQLALCGLERLAFRIRTSEAPCWIRPWVPPVQPPVSQWTSDASGSTHDSTSA